MKSNTMSLNALFLAFCFVSNSLLSVAMASRCEPEMLAKLPPKKRSTIEKRCAKEASKSAYTITNKGQEGSELMPENHYKGSDLNMLLSEVEKAWKQKYPQDKIMAVVINSSEWKRDVNLRANATSLYKTDKSVLGVKVIIKTNSKYATIFPAFLNRDNQDGIINAGVATKKNRYVIKQMLVKNVTS